MFFDTSIFSLNVANIAINFLSPYRNKPYEKDTTVVITKTKAPYPITDI